jgi:hypothetical protein
MHWTTNVKVTVCCKYCLGNALAGGSQVIKYLWSVNDVFRLKTADWRTVVNRRCELILLMWDSLSAMFCVGTAAHRFAWRPVICITCSKWSRVEMFLTSIRFLYKHRPVEWDRHPLCEGQILYSECLSVFSECACSRTTLQLCGGIGQMSVAT